MVTESKEEEVKTLMHRTKKKKDEIAMTVCDVCRKPARYDECASRGSSGWASVCPTCDLPDGWAKKWSSGKKRPYYYHRQKRLVRWAHPAPGNPLYSDREVNRQAEFKKPSKLPKLPKPSKMPPPPASIRKPAHAPYRPTAPGYYGSAYYAAT